MTSTILSEAARVQLFSCRLNPPRLSNCHMCKRSIGAYTCTLPVNHSEPHVAHGSIEIYRMQTDDGSYLDFSDEPLLIGRS